MTNTNSQDVYDVIIIGSGLSGITAARLCHQQGKSCLVLDKGRRIGGRCSTKRLDGMIFNHGAQFFTASDPDFIALSQTAIADGALGLWSFGHHRDSYIGLPVMRDFISYLATGLEVRQSVKVTSISKQNNIYHLIDEAADRYQARHIIVTVPAPQAVTLLEALDAHLADTARGASYSACWTVMLGLAEAMSAQRLPLRNRGDIGWASYEPHRMSDGAAHSYQPAITIQATADKSTAMLAWDKQDVIAAMSAALSDEIGPLPEVIVQAAHRWLYARVAVPADAQKPFISADGTIALAGDYFGQARLESAYLSGRRAAQALSAKGL